MAVAATNQVFLVFIVIFFAAEAGGGIAVAAAARVSRKQLVSPTNTVPPLVGSEAANISRGEYLELKRQLESLNKPAVKSIQTVSGDIFDCVDIYKQPSLDHPLLKDHKIQMWPTSFPKEPESKQNRTASKREMEVKIELPDGGCPEGTVPIRRTTMQDLLRMKSMSKLKNKAKSTDDERPDHHVVSVRTKDYGDYYGVRADLNNWNPRVFFQEEYSSVKVWVENDDEIVEFGWTVQPIRYGDYITRLFVSWTADNYDQTGCFNEECQGYVQVSNLISPGSEIQPVSYYEGKQYYCTLHLFRDPSTQNWWVVLGGQPNLPMGYFPATLFKSLEEKASTVYWGGEVYSPPGLKQPHMGSGHFPSEGFGKAAFIRSMKTTDVKFVYRDAPNDTVAFSDELNCYSVDDPNQHGGQEWERFFYFGGPGC